MKKLVISAVCLAVLAACSDGTKDQSKAADKVASKVAEKVTDKIADKVVSKTLNSGIDKSHFDMSVRPQDDLYRHVNGAWLDTFEIPADKSNYGAFTALAEKAEKDVKAIIEDTGKGVSEKGSDSQKVGDTYKSFMNVELIEKLGVSPIKADLAAIDAIKDMSDLSEYMATADILTTAPFGVYVYIDLKEPTKHITYMGQSGLGLPGRDYYLDEDEKSQKIREQYVAHMAKMFTLAGVDKGQERAETVMKIETELASKHRSKEENRDPIKRYNKFSFADLQKKIPSMDWTRWEQNTGIKGIKEVVVSQPEYIDAMESILTSVSLDDWKSYYKWHLITAAAAYLNADLDNENFNFYSKTLNGVQEQKPRWKRAVNLINGTLGEIVGKIYVERHFKPEAKVRMKTLVENLRAAYDKGIKELEWMGEDTKKQALDKLHKFNPKIGYPDKWKDYSGIVIDADDLVGNMRSAQRFFTQVNRDKLGQPIDRDEWGMSPQTVNAYYNPALNEIVFPAAILQPPFFNMDADDAVNYGGIGAVIGHEMGHGFDDSGAKFDGDGQLRNWWTEQDEKEFGKRTDKLVAQYDNFTVLDGTHVNGEFTQGENIGDLGGLTIAYKAYQLSKGDEAAPIIDGMTGDQRVFYGWAQVWGRKYRDENLLMRIKTDPHSPSEFRTNGTVANMPEFMQAFDVKPGDKMYTAPEDRVKIW